MFEAEFTYPGDRCTFEVLLARTELAAPALTAIAEAVHDIDLKEGSSAGRRRAAPPMSSAGLPIANGEDERRVERSAAVPDDLSEYFHKERSQGRRP